MTAALCIDGPKKGEVLEVRDDLTTVVVPVLPPARWGTLDDLDLNAARSPGDEGLSFERYAYHLHRLHLFGRRVDVLSGEPWAPPRLQEGLNAKAAEALLGRQAFALWRGGERRP